jgi:hypothetical protein
MTKTEDLKNRIQSWDHENVSDLLEIIREYEDHLETIREYEPKATAEIDFSNLPSEEIPDDLETGGHAGTPPIWAMDKAGRVLVGWSFSVHEMRILSLDEVRERQS